MDLFTLIIVAVVIGVMVWAIQTYAPIAQPLKGLLILLIILLFCAWILNGYGVFNFGHVRVGRG